MVDEASRYWQAWWWSRFNLVHLWFLNEKGAIPTLALGRDMSESHLVLIHLAAFAGGIQGTLIKKTHVLSLTFFLP